MEKLLLRPREAAEAIGVGRSKIYELLAKGEIPSVRIGANCVRVPVAELKAWVASKTNPTPEADCVRVPVAELKAWVASKTNPTPEAGGDVSSRTVANGGQP